MNQPWADRLHEFICQPIARAYNAIAGDESILNEVDELENKLLKLILKDIDGAYQRGFDDGVKSVGKKGLKKAIDKAWEEIK